VTRDELPLRQRLPYRRAMRDGRLERLLAEGVALWLDGLVRGHLESGDLARLVSDRCVSGAVYGLATLAGAVDAPAYEGLLTDLAARGLAPAEAVRTLIAHDVRLACDLLRPVHERGPYHDGLVSADLPAGPAAATLAESRALWWTVDRPNLLVRIPPTPDRLPAVSACLAEGIGVDVGPVFSVERYGEVLDAYFDGMERARAAGLLLSRISSVASFPLAALDAGVDERLHELGRGEAPPVPHRVCQATARLAYQLYEQRFSSERWQRLALAGARPQRLLWTGTTASCGDTRHVDGFVAWGVISAMSRKTLDAVADRALLAGDTLSGRHISARRDRAALAALGIDHAALAARLESETQRELADWWVKLVLAVTTQLDLRRG
jgi:transaldolase